MHALLVSATGAFRGFVRQYSLPAPAVGLFFCLFACSVFSVPDALAQAATGLPPGDSFDLVSDHLEWNVWIEKATPGQTKPSFKPVSNPPNIHDYAWHLQPEREYLLIVHLSEHRYRDGMAAHPNTGHRLRQYLADALTSQPIPKTLTLTGSLGEEQEEVGFRVSRPPRARLALGTTPSPMTVQINRILKQIRKGTPPDPAVEGSNSFSLLAKRKDASFVYGQLVFRLNTSRREGMVGLAVILTANGQEMDRLDKRIELCVAAKASERKACPPPATASVKGDDAINKLQWNFWTEPRPTPASRPQFSAAPALSPDQGGLLVLDMAALAYKEKGVSSKSVGTKLKEAIEEWLKTLPPSQQEVPVTVVAVPDRAYFELADGQSMQQTLNIRLDKIRALRETDTEIKADNPLQVLAKGEDPVWELGNVAYAIKTLPNEGMTSVAFSIWAEQNGKQRPVDELVATFCIAKDPATCTGSQKLSSGSLSGLDSLKLSSEPGAPFPDAAVHFVALSKEGPVTGIFRRNDQPKGEFSVWPLDKEFPADRLKSHLSDSLLIAVAKARTDQDLRAAGRNLYNFLFHSKTVARGSVIPPSEMDEGHKARVAFEAFIRDRVKPADVSSRDVPAVFVRLVGHDDLIPLGLLPIKPTEHEEDFLGFRFRVETPLKVQSYRPEPGCISRWALAAPTEQHHEPALTEAWKQASTVITKWRAGIADSDKPSTMRGFEDWLAELTQDPMASAVVTLSHHDRNLLRLEPENDIAGSDAIQRQFLKPSLAVINGCGTAKPGANEFIRKLNETSGVSAVIATSAEVEPEMAGDFFNCLDAVLEQHKSDAAYTIAYAYFDTLQCLKDKRPADPDAQYGARVLKYALLGNGSLKLCSPKKP